jgi:hypothetical protein
MKAATLAASGRSPKANNHIRHGQLLLILALCLLPGRAVAQKSPAPLERIAVVGASMSAGFGTGPSPLAGGITIADIAQYSIVGEHAVPRNLASVLAYLGPASYMERAVESLSQDPPSAIVALDYLFWSVYGDKPDAARQKELEAALTGLEKFSCPILVGDLPDVTIAAAAPARAITPAMIPTAAARNAANTRLREWARERKNVTVIPLADLMKNVASGSPIQVRGNVWKESEARNLLQADLLHPTVEGLVVVWIAAVDEWLKSESGLAESAFELRPKTLLDAAMAKLKAPK